jgi:signal transduction histidine kinase
MARLVPGPDLPLADVIRRICELAADTLAVERVGVWYLSDDRSALRCVNLFERSRRQHSAGATLRVADFPTYFAALDQMTAVPAALAATDPLTAELGDAYFHPLGITSTLDAAILLDGRLSGVVCHEHTGPSREWTNEERDFASSVADLIALKVKSAELSQVRAALRTQDEQLHKNGRLDALVQFAAGIAHDFKNLLAVIVGTAGQLERTPGLPPGTAEQLEQILSAVDRAAILANELTQFARGHVRPAAVVAVAETVEALLPFLRTAAGDRHPIDFQQRPGVGKAFLDPAGLERALVNLVLNARDAMPGGGTIRIAVGPAGEPGGPVAVRLEISDSGPGIDPALRDRIFEPFVSTKRAGSGNGLGLAVVKQVVDRAGGTIAVNSEPGRGTTFRIDLPRVCGA